MKSEPPGKEENVVLHRPRLIAFYLPQFYPTPYNDEWWGKGFTEWTNVVQGKPHFKGHYQPHLPADLGFYDLRLPETRQAQADLAREYGIGGFCYYHYWFQGTRILERPLDEVLASGKPDFPFCVCWANESWTRTWKGHKNKVLMQQEYSRADDLAHIRYLMPTLSDDRYIKIDGKPLLLVYRVELLPNPADTADIWRNEALKHGLPGLFLVRVESNYVAGQTSPAEAGFDESMRFQPNLAAFSTSSAATRSLGKKLRERYPKLYAALQNSRSESTQDRIYEYADFYKKWKESPPSPDRHFECVTPMWDNSARRARGAHILNNSTPELYERWLREAVARSAVDSGGHKNVFINAWNEWAEGCHLEPCQKWGLQYLEATKRVYLG